jgi:hypothetical protein
LLSRSPSQVADLCEQFSRSCAIDLSTWLVSALDIPATHKLAVVALTSSTLGLDLFILHHLCIDRTFENRNWYYGDDLLIDICVGRNNEDLRQLGVRYAQMYGKSPVEAFPVKAFYDLKGALDIVLEVSPTVILTNVSSTARRRLKQSTRILFRRMWKLLRLSFPRVGLGGKVSYCSILSFGVPTCILHRYATCISAVSTFPSTRQSVTVVTSVGRREQFSYMPYKVHQTWSSVTPTPSSPTSSPVPTYLSVWTEFAPECAECTNTHNTGTLL